MPPPYTHPLDDPLTVHLQPPIPVEKHDNAALMKDAVERTELRRSLAALAGMDDMTTMPTSFRPFKTSACSSNYLAHIVFSFPMLSLAWSGTSQTFQKATCLVPTADRLRRLPPCRRRHREPSRVGAQPSPHSNTPSTGIRLAIDPRRIVGGLDLLTMTRRVAPHAYSDDVPRDELLDLPVDVRRWTQEV